MILPHFKNWLIGGYASLLSAFVERRRPKTYTFVLPVGEVTVTLEDVAHIFGLLIDGEVVSGGVIPHDP
ncbi:hypothetical protein AHAS_Ahas16G0164800 [Arachis hypogaea]